MASTKSPETEKWKVKYYDLLDRFDKKESVWNKSEKLLSSSLSRVSLLAEGEDPQIDAHLHALRVVLKEKFDLYRVESVLTELLKLITEIEKKSKNKKTIKVELDIIVEMLGGIKLPKDLQRKKALLLKELKKNPELIDSTSENIRELFQEFIDEQSPGDTGGLFSRMFSNKSSHEKDETLSVLSDAMKAIPWRDDQLQQCAQLTQALNKCKDPKDLDAVLVKFTDLVQTLETNSKSKKTVSSGLSVDLNEEKIKQQSLNDLIDNLKKSQPENEKIQSIELADNKLSDEPVLLAQAISSLIGLSSDSISRYDSDEAPKLREVFIQLLEQLVVPVSLMDKVEKLKSYLEQGNDAEWQFGLKKIAQFINEVRFQQYQEEGGYEDFLQEITNRLQEMVQFLVDENKEIESNNSKGSELNAAVKNEVEGLRQGVEASATLDALQSVVNSRLDSISEFMLQHSQLEKKRYDFAKINLAKMQAKIHSLESETAELKVNLEEKNREAMYDALTEIPNRLFYEKRVKEDIARWQRFDTPLSVAIWDVDKFKNVNDTYGHKAGDKVLRAIAQILNKRIRETDFLARYGGEEFVMLLPGTVEEETLRLANELRQAVADCAFHYNDKAVEITISCGISGFRAEDTIGKVFERADKALYQAKESGRNRCVIAGCLSTD